MAALERLANPLERDSHHTCLMLRQKWWKHSCRLQGGILSKNTEMLRHILMLLRCSQWEGQGEDTLGGRCTQGKEGEEPSPWRRWGERKVVGGNQREVVVVVAVVVEGYNQFVVVGEEVERNQWEEGEEEVQGGHLVVGIK